MLDIDLIEILTLLLALLGVWQYLNRNDEFPLLLILFFYLTGIARYNAVMSGTSRWAYVAYAYNIFEMNEELAIEALNYFFLGTAVFTITYIIASSRRPQVFFLLHGQRPFFCWPYCTLRGLREKGLLTKLNV